MARTYVVSFAGDYDDAEEFETEVEADALIMAVRIVDDDDEPQEFEYRVTPQGIELLDA